MFPIKLHSFFTVSSLAVAVTIASTHYAYTWRDGQAEWAWVPWLDTKMVYPRTVTHLSTNPARRRVTSLMRPTMLPLSQTATELSLVPDYTICWDDITMPDSYLHWQSLVQQRDAAAAAAG